MEMWKGEWTNALMVRWIDEWLNWRLGGLGAYIHKDVEQVQQPALLENYDRQTNQPTDREVILATVPECWLKRERWTWMAK